MADVEIDDQIRNCILNAIEQHTFPGAVVGYINGDDQHILPFGRITYDAIAPAVTADTVYDLASVTKSIPTASVILKLAEVGKLSLDDQVEKFVPEVARNSHGQVLIRHLLTYTAVFDHKEHLSDIAIKGRDAILHTIYNSPLKFPPGNHYYYADAPYILLGAVAEKAGGESLDKLADELLFAPLSMRHTTFHPEKLTGAIVAPTEKTVHGIIQGEPNDEKARAFLREGTVTGHAGLFSTAPDLLRFCRMLLHGGSFEGHQYFSPTTIRRMQEEVVLEGANGVSLAWRTKHPWLVSSILPPHTFGKEGFTGPFVLVDPEGKRCLVLLANRTYPKRPDTTTAIQKVRRSLEVIFFG